MIKHTIEIAEHPARLSLRHRQLVLDFGKDVPPRQFACEDIGVLVLQHPAISLSTAALNALLENGAAIIVCNEKHLPAGTLLPTQTHTELIPRMAAQFEAGRPARKRAWAAIVRAKIEAQAREIENPAKRKLTLLAKHVKSGDPENNEAQAARIYWSARFPEVYAAGDKRDPDGESIFNALLNYGYAILRAAVARALVSSGLHPALGVFHHRRNNPYCLADDLMEPLRPLVDRTVAKILSTIPEDQAPEALCAEHRRELLALLAAPVSVGDSTGPLMANLPRYTSGFHRLLTGNADHLLVPVF